MDFFIKRFARLYPVHLVTLLAVFGIFLLSKTFGIALNNLNHKYDMRQLLPNIFLIQSWFPFTNPAFNDPAWSISAEFLAYLMFPFIGKAI